MDDELTGVPLATSSQDLPWEAEASDGMRMATLHGRRDVAKAVHAPSTCPPGSGTRRTATAPTRSWPAWSGRSPASQ